MSEWWTYRLGSFLLFSPRTWLRLHELYNADIWPTQLAALALGIAVLVLARRAGAWPGRVVALLLAACWLWVAWAFHLRRYATINFAATYFAAAFFVQAALLIGLGAIRGRLSFEHRPPLARSAGFWLFAFALLVQPAIGPLVGRTFLQSEYFGVAPDPTATATLGALLLAQRPPWALALVPLLWCALSGAFAWMMRPPDALVMPIVAVVAVAAAFARRRPDSQRSRDARVA